MSKSSTKNFVLDGEEEEEKQWEEVPIKNDVNNALFYDEIVDTWIDLRLYVEDEKLPWLDKKDAFVNFASLCGYREK